MSDTQRKTVQATMRNRFLSIKTDYQRQDVREPEVGALLELIIDQQMQIDKLLKAAEPTALVDTVLDREEQIIAALLDIASSGEVGEKFARTVAARDCRTVCVGMATLLAPTLHRIFGDDAAQLLLNAYNKGEP